MNKDYSFVFIENKIGFTWQVCNLSAISYPGFIQKSG